MVSNFDNGALPSPSSSPSDWLRQKSDRALDIATSMKKYVDPRTGTISYSGADFKAVVFLPFSGEQLIAEINRLRVEAQEVQSKIATWTQYGLSGPDYLKTLQFEVDVYNKEIDRLRELQSKTELYVRPVELFDIQTISMSSHREKFPVRALGRVNPKSFTRGPRTLAGSMIFTLFNKHALWDLVQAGSNFYSSGVGIHGTDSGFPELTTVLVDQLPPFDITLTASNELGDTSYMTLYGVEIVNDGRTISIQDIITEGVMQFVCRDFEDLRPLLSRRQSLAAGIRGSPKTASEIARERLTERARRRIRLNPFI
jgi:hypothetical protein